MLKAMLSTNYSQIRADINYRINNFQQKIWMSSGEDFETKTIRGL